MIQAECMEKQLRASRFKWGSEIKEIREFGNIIADFLDCCQAAGETYDLRSRRDLAPKFEKNPAAS